MADEKDQAQDKLALVRDAVKVGVYEHYKGGLYTVFSHTIREDTLEPLIHYYSHAKKTRWTRTMDDFSSYVKDNVPRFKYVRDAESDELLWAVGLFVSFTVKTLPNP